MRTRSANLENQALGKLFLDFKTAFKTLAAGIFEVIFKGLQDHAEPYRVLYIETDKRLSKSLDDLDLPYTFDLLVLEEIEFLSDLLRSSELKRQLSETVFANPTYVSQMMSLLVTYVSVAAEEEGMWDMDINIFLQGETSVISSSYITRDAIATKLATAYVEDQSKEIMSGAVQVMHAIFGREDAT